MWALFRRHHLLVWRVERSFVRPATHYWHRGDTLCNNHLEALSSLSTPSEIMLYGNPIHFTISVSVTDYRPQVTSQAVTDYSPPDAKLCENFKMQKNSQLPATLNNYRKNIACMCRDVYKVRNAVKTLTLSSNLRACALCSCEQRGYMYFSPNSTDRIFSAHEMDCISNSVHNYQHHHK